MWERWCAGKAGEEGKVRVGDMFVRPVSPAHSPMLRIDPRRPPRVKKGGNKGVGDAGGMAVGGIWRGGKGGNSGAVGEGAGERCEGSRCGVYGGRKKKPERTRSGLGF